MKLLAILFTVLFAYVGVSQTDTNSLSINSNNGIIKIRKVVRSFDTLSTIEKRLDSTGLTQRHNIYKTRKGRPRYKGFISDNILFKGSYLYFFSEDISNRLQKKFRIRDYKGFWSKVRRLEKRNKLYVYKIRISYQFIDSVKQLYYNNYHTSELRDKSTNELSAYEINKIPNSEEIQENHDAKIEFVANRDTFYIPFARGGRSNVSACFGNDCVLNFINSFASETNANSLFVVKLDCKKTIDYNQYYFEFDLKKYKSKQVRIVKNDNTEFICDYKIKGNRFIITNPPIPEFSEGKINRRKTKIRFKIHHTYHDYQVDAF